MPVIHYLNVRQGDCIGIEHNSGHKTVIDVCNAAEPITTLEAILKTAGTLEAGVSGNFNQKKCPVNPISYFRDRGWSRVFRFILTHPDMDHMDGLKAFFKEFGPANFWDTDNVKGIDPLSWGASPYKKEDWTFYKTLRDGKPTTDPKRLTLFSGAKGKYFNQEEDGTGGGDGLHILAPTTALVDAANESDCDFNACSYVLLYQTGTRRIVFGGDSDDSTWEHILSTHRQSVTDVDLLIAPHHGRASGRSYEFLDVLRPKMTFFGNASSEHLAYGAWNNRKLAFITNNQANCMIARVVDGSMGIYGTHEKFARAMNPSTTFDTGLRAWLLRNL